jgi:hypothetical protein
MVVFHFLANGPSVGRSGFLLGVGLKKRTRHRPHPHRDAHPPFSPKNQDDDEDEDEHDWPAMAFSNWLLTFQSIVIAGSLAKITAVEQAKPAMHPAEIDGD